MSAQLASIADALATLRTAQRRSPAERRRFRRLPLELSGRMLDGFGRELDCRTADISPGDVRIRANAENPIGERVVFYLSELGRLEGRVTRTCAPGEFAVVLNATAHKKEKLAESLTRLINPDLVESHEARRAERIAGHGHRIMLENGETIEGEILDFSLVGMAVRTPARPPLGSWVRVGALDGRIARYIDDGVAIDFERRT